MAVHSIDALAMLWNMKTPWTVDTITPRHWYSGKRVWGRGGWFKKDFGAMKWSGCQLEWCWRKAKSKADRTIARTHYLPFAVAVMFATTVASRGSHPAALFHTVRGPRDTGKIPTAAHCAVAGQFAEKISCIHLELDSELIVQNRELQVHPSSPVLWGAFQLIQSEDVDRILRNVRPTYCMLDPCPLWLIKAT